MNIPIKQYAKILYNIIDGKSKNEAEKIIKDFAAAMVANNDQGKIKKIIIEFNNLWNKEKGIVEAEIVSAKELDNEIVKLLNGYIVKLSGAREVVANEKVDKDILGGVVVKHGDRVVDGSLKTKINSFKIELTK